MAKPVIQMNLKGKKIRVFKSAQEAADTIGCSRSVISLACTNLSHRAMGCLWEYEEEYE